MPFVFAFVLMFLTTLGEAQTPNLAKGSFGHGKEESYKILHLTDVHIGEGSPRADHGTPGHLADTLTGHETGGPVFRLRSMVHWLQQNARAHNIDLVIVSGDLTDSGERSEFLLFKQVMDSANLPYVPLMGNHDAWPYVRYQNESHKANGDSLMNEIFGLTFESLKSHFNWRADLRTMAVTDPISGRTAFLQNFSFSHKGVRYVFIDLNPRYHVRLPEPGIGAEACVPQGPNTTLAFLTEQLHDARTMGEKVVVISHHPPITLWYKKHYSLIPFERKLLRKAIKPFKVQIIGWLCGHFHRSATYRAMGGVKVYETRANKSVENGVARLVQVRP